MNQKTKSLNQAKLDNLLWERERAIACKNAVRLNELEDGIARLRDEIFAERLAKAKVAA